LSDAVEALNGLPGKYSLFSCNGVFEARRESLELVLLNVILIDDYEDAVQQYHVTDGDHLQPPMVNSYAVPDEKFLETEPYENPTLILMAWTGFVLNRCHASFIA
jgi:hypothetical protein